MAAVAALLTVTAACGGDSTSGGEDEDVTLHFTWWGNADRAELTEQAIDLFEEEHPGITIETSFSEFDAYWERMATQIAGGSAPDILQMDYRYVREYAERNVLREFGDDDVDTSAMAPGLLSAGEIDGVSYAIPMSQNTQALLYDPAAWAAAGEQAPGPDWTWADLEAGGRVVAEATGISAISDFGQIEDWFEVWLRQRGKTLYTDDGELGYTAEDVAEYWTFTNGLREAGIVTPADETATMDGSQANSPLAKQTSAAEFNYDSGLTAESWEIYGRELALAPFPSDSGELGQYAKPSMLICISQRSEHPEEAAQFIDFLLNDPEVGELLGTSRGMPANADIREAVGGALTGPPQLAFEFEQAVLPELADAPPPPPRGAGSVKAAFQRIYDDVIFGSTTPEEAAERFMSEAEQALAQ
ncbi:carbohydrate ABC transporter substrate-binding protein [Jiangella aurantiaca]|uniref:Carbohydrate ABC transporter substrate-binding protein n=2 Tax=Jiangella aurantiaca TaxID=2530373 RepID=A0A4R5A438_9ACTN|nr:carbohydrate ABC transporter substrate-binding protein [Jiangella aurantiaca]